MNDIWNECPLIFCPSPTPGPKECCARVSYPLGMTLGFTCSTELLECPPDISRGLLTIKDKTNERMLSVTIEVTPSSHPALPAAKLSNMSSSLATFAFKRARTLARPAVQQALVTHGLNTRRRGVTILAPGIHSGDPNIIIEGPTPGSRSSTIDAAGGNGSNSSQHPYASVGRNPNEAPAAGKQQQGQQQPGSPGMEGISLTSLPEPSSIPASSSGPSRPHPDHPFDTHSFVTRIEQSGFDAEASRSLMEVTKDMITARSNQARDNLLHKEDQENVSLIRGASK